MVPTVLPAGHSIRACIGIGAALAGDGGFQTILALRDHRVILAGRKV